jgi:hypothetical protein
MGNLPILKKTKAMRPKGQGTMTGTRRNLLVACGMLMVASPVVSHAESAVSQPEPAAPTCLEPTLDTVNYVHHRFHDVMPYFIEVKKEEHASDDAYKYVFASCMAGWQMRFVEQSDQAVSLLNHMLYSEKSYTRAQIRRVLREAGFETKISSFSSKHCACSVNMEVNFNDTQVAE